MLKLISFTVLLFIAIIFVGACSGQPKPSAPTAGQLADAGKVVFASRCAGCHGDSGQGSRAPAVIGANASLGKYNTAEGLLNFVSTAMPMNAPGSLSQQDYLDVVSYLLVQNNLVPAGTALDASRLGSINLK